jgi:hypothetical protein
MCYTASVDWEAELVRPPQVMALRHAVPKTPPRPSGSPRSPIHKPRLLPTHLESTLLQVFIPRHFKSFISNAYRKPQGEAPPSTPKVLQLVTAPLPSAGARTATLATPIRPYGYFTVLWIPGGGGMRHGRVQPLQSYLRCHFVLYLGGQSVGMIQTCNRRRCVE